jgi:integrase
MTYYARLLADEGVAIVAERKPSTGTLGWLVEEYKRSADFGRLDERTQRTRSGILAAAIAETVAPDSAMLFHDVPVAKLTTKGVRVLRDRKADKPEAANNRVKAIRRLLAFGVAYEHVDRNVARDVPYFSSGSQGFHAWTLDEVERFEAAHPLGSKARLALALLLYTGQRRSDVVAFGPESVRDGWLVFVQHKNRNRKPVALEIPIRPELQEAIDRADLVGAETFLVTDYGRPFTSNGFGNKFRDWCDQAGLPHCSAHGLRKAAATRLAENGATEKQIAAITGHTTLKEVERYTRAANQRRLAGQAFKLGVKDNESND